MGIDIGEPGNIHPKNKQDVGKRLALVALKEAYGMDVVSGGPVVDTAVFSQDKVSLTFDAGGADQQLVIREDSHSGFELAGPDGTFAPASVELKDNTLMVTAPGVSEPRIVRYAWADNPSVTLFNTAGLPAAPFVRDGP